MFKAPVLQLAEFDKEILGEPDQGEEEEEDAPMCETNSLELNEHAKDPSPPGRAIDDYEDLGSFRSTSQMTDIPEPPNARDLFGRLPSPNLELCINSNFSRPPYLNPDRRRSGANTPTNGYRSNNEIDARREQQRMDNPRLARPASVNNGGSNYNNFPPPRQNFPNGDFNPQIPPPPIDQQYGNQQQQHQFPPSQDARNDQYSNHSTHDTYAPNFNQETYVNENGYRTIPPQSFHSQPRRDQQYDNGYPPYNNFNGMQFRPRPYRRQWRPPVTNNFNFINVPFNHQFYGYPQQAQSMIDYAQAAASMATLRTAYQHDYNIARNTQRVVPVKEEDEEDIAVLFEGPPKDPKTIISKRKRKSSSITGSCSSAGSDDSVIFETSSNATSQIPSKQSRASSSSAFSLQVHPFSSAPELAAYTRDVETPIPQMLGLSLGAAPNSTNDEVEDGEIVEIYCTNSSKPVSQAPDDKPQEFIPKPVSEKLGEVMPKPPAEMPINKLPEFIPKKIAEVPLDRLPQFMQKPIVAKEAEHLSKAVVPKPAESTPANPEYDPSHPLYDPLLDDDLALADSVVLEDEAALLEEDATEKEQKAKETEEQVLKRFPDLRLTETDEGMNE